MNTLSRLGPPARRFFGVPLRAQTYRNLVSLGLAFPLGVCYFIGLVTGFSMGLGLAVTLVGLPILFATLVGAVVVAGFEARLARRLVGVDVDPPAVLREMTAGDGFVMPGDGYLDAARRLLTSPSTWTSVVLLFVKFVFGIVSFTALVVTATLSAVLVLAPLLYTETSIGFVEPAAVGSYNLGPVVVDTLAEALVVSAGGVLVAVVGLHLLNLLARLHATYTAVLLNIGN